MLEYYAERNIKAVHFPIHDFNEGDLTSKIFEAAKILHEMIDKEGRHVYVHCTAGMGRAPASVLVYLCLFKKVKCWSNPTDVDKFVKSYRKVSVPNMRAVYSVVESNKYSDPHWLAGQRSKCAIESLWSGGSLELVLVVLGSKFEVVSILLVERLHGELLLVVLEQSSQLKVVLGVQVGLNRHVVLNQLQELLLKLIDFLSHKEGVDEREISVGKVPIVPYLLGNEQRAQEERSPVGGLQRHFGKCN